MLNSMWSAHTHVMYYRWRIKRLLFSLCDQIKYAKKNVFFLVDTSSCNLTLPVTVSHGADHCCRLSHPHSPASFTSIASPVQRHRLCLLFTLPLLPSAHAASCSYSLLNSTLLSSGGKVEGHSGQPSCSDEIKKPSRYMQPPLSSPLK